MTNMAMKTGASSREVASHGLTERSVSEARSESAAMPAPFSWTQRERTELPVRIVGSVPAWLSGDLVRTAPAVFEQGSWRAQHYFDALGLIYGFSFGDGVRFKQQKLASRFASEIDRGSAATGSFGTDMKRGFFKRALQPIPHVTDNANVNVIPWQGQWLAMTETPHQHVIDGKDLRSRGVFVYDDELPSSMSMSAHPHFDFERKALVNVGTLIGAKNELCVYRQAAGSTTRVVEGKLAFKQLPYLHDFGLTPRHALIIDHPLTVHPLKLLFSNRGFNSCMRWNAERGTRLWKLSRETGKWTSYETESLFCFHTVNAFDDGDDVVFDFLAYDDASIVEKLKLGPLLERGHTSIKARYVRARLSPGKQHADLQLLSEQRFEFPNIAYRQQHGHRYDVAWGVAINPEQQGASESEIVRVDLQGDTVQRFGDSGVLYGEPVFVPRPGAARSEDGVLLSLGSHLQEERATLAVLDASTLEPLARCHVELSLPLGFHGSFQGR